MVSPISSERVQTSSPVRYNPVQQLILPRPVIAFLTYLAARGKCYLAGGAVRDLMLNRQPADFDLVSDLTPDQLAAAFPQAKEMMNVTKTFILHLEGIEIEITPMQNKGYSRIEDDLIQRDLTINAMALPFLLRNGKVTVGTLLDPTGKGVEDLIAGRIRFGRKVAGDTLLRACRFMAKFDFQFDEEQKQLVSENRKLVIELPPEKAQVEIQKLLEASDPVPTLQLMRETGLLEEMLKFSGAPDRSRLEKADLEKVAKADKSVRLIVLLKELGYTSKDVVRFLNKYRYSSYEIKRTQKLLAAIEAAEQNLPAMAKSDRAIREALFQLVGNKEKNQYLADYIELLKLFYTLSDTMEIRIRNAARSPLSIKELKVTGNDIMEQGISNRHIGEALNYLLQLVIADPELNQRETLLNELAAFKRDQ